MYICSNPLTSLLISSLFYHVINKCTKTFKRENISVLLAGVIVATQHVLNKIVLYIYVIINIPSVDERIEDALTGHNLF